MSKRSNDQDGEKKRAKPHGPRPFWSGTITFGLVSLPVSLFVATRSKKVSLRMIDDAGESLARRYFCPKQERALEPDEIVRGYAVEKDKFVVVKDDELDAIAPQKSQEIDLRRFVPVDEIDPMYFERAYFLAPGKGATKPYRLLAKSMEATGRAGIATCVIRGSEYLIAILSNRGILRAEILRFADELRSPDDVGLSETAKPDAGAVKRMEKAIQAKSGKRLDDNELVDAQAERILKRVNDKLKADKDVIHEPDDAEAVEPSGDNDPVDLMAALKASLQQNSGRSKKQSKKSNTQSSKKARSKRSGTTKSGGRTKQTNRSREELYQRAQKLGIAGRSKMNKDELAAAVDAA
jgi:DNA end-binding protein Ku